MMYLMIDKAADFDFACVAFLWGLGIFTVMCVVMGIIEAIDERRAARKRRKSGKRYTVEIRPGRRY